MFITERQVHVVIGCADARDVGGLFADALAAVSERYAARGVEVGFHALRTAGSFVTRDVIDDLRRIIEVEERRAATLVRYAVHIQTHGEVEEGGEPERSPIERISIVPGSRFNCGMLGASNLSVELERLLLRVQPEVVVRGRRLRLRDAVDLRALLVDVYAHRGTIAGDWIRSIDDLRTHPRAQEGVLRDAIASDRTLRSVDLEITTGIQDYRKNAYFRLDDRWRTATLWDEVHEEVCARAARLSAEHPEVEQRTATQAPRLGLFTTCDFPGARRVAAAHLAAVLATAEPLDPFGPNRVFTFASESFDLPHSPFGPYTIAGFFYAVAHLGLRHFVVLGHDAAQSRRMIARLENDPLVRVIETSFEVAFHPLVADHPGT